MKKEPRRRSEKRRKTASLEAYRRNRRFDQTPEPSGGSSTRPEPGRHYVIQKHDATRLHYDFRLELEGVLKSWAVPKGPSLDPEERRLAIHVEDHPVEYGDFEGIIPKDEYGGGTVIVWDRGRWFPEGDPVRDYEKGRLHFRIEGKKLRGKWTLVRTKLGRVDEDGKDNWLLIKKKDEDARPGAGAALLETRPESVASGRGLDQIAANPGRVWSSETGERAAAGVEGIADMATARRKIPTPVAASEVAGAREAALPRRLQPQLAVLRDAAPEGGGWLHELKLDGYRILCRIEEDEGVRLITRGGEDWTAKFTRIQQAAGALPVREAVVDGELVAMREDGVTSFELLQQTLSGDKHAALRYCVFDLLYLDGHDLRRSPLRARKAALAELLEAAPAGVEPALFYSEQVIGNGPAFYEEACGFGVEGILSKRIDSPYRGRRHPDWLKVKCLHRDEFLIGGFTEPSGGRSGFGSLILGQRKGSGELVYAGRVGTGFTDRMLQKLHRELRKYERPESPFAGGPVDKVPADAHWVDPVLIANVAFTEHTRDGVLRHPSFKSFRVAEKREKGPEVESSTAERAATTGPADVRVTNPDRVVYPHRGITKIDVADYYAAVVDTMLPYVRSRPLMLRRCPRGQGEDCFIQKHANASVPDVVKRIELVEGAGGKGETAEHLYVDSLAALVGLVQMGALEIHMWGSTAKNLDRPDIMIFDLDPDPAVSWERVVRGARHVRARILDLGLIPFVKTTGGKGLHVVVPIKPRTDWDTVRAFSKGIADSLVREAPDHYTAKLSKSRRGGRIFIDYLRNARGATAIAPYSTRDRPCATVATPLRWDELRPGLNPDRFAVDMFKRRLGALKEDPWASFEGSRRPISPKMLEKIREESE